MSEQKRVAARAAYYRMLAERAARAGKARVVTVIAHDPHRTPLQRAHAAADARVTPESLTAWQAEHAALTAKLPPLAPEDFPLRKPRVRRVRTKRVPWVLKKD
ncbi:hypothetical protein [Paraburkholderia strydomiana]